MGILRRVKHEQFAHRLAKGDDQTAAYDAVGYRHNPGHASRLANRPDIKARVKELLEPSIRDVTITIDRVLDEMTCLAFYDITDLLLPSEPRQNGRGELMLRMKNPKDLPPEFRRAILSIKPIQIDKEMYFECKMADKRQALELLGRHLQMFKDTVVVENVFRVIMDMPDDELDRRIAELESTIGEGPGPASTAGKGPSTIN